MIVKVYTCEYRYVCKQLSFYSW